jgi:hypothetical protein
LDRRAFFRVTAGSIVAAGAVLGTACDDDAPPGDSGGDILSDRAGDAFFSDDFVTEGHGWGDDWLNVRYESAWWVAAGAGVSEVPPGIPKALAPGKGHTEYMAQPVVHPGAETAAPVVSATVLLDGPVEAGLIVCASFDESYALLLRNGKVLLCRYGITDRKVLAQSSLQGTDDWVQLSLGVDAGLVQGGAFPATGKRVTLEFHDDDPLPAGLVGTLVNPISDAAGGRGKFKAFRATADEKPPPPRARFTHRFAGAMVATGSKYKARVTARTVLPGDVYFEFSTSENFESTTVTPSLSPEGRLGAVHGWLEGLEPATTYHWRPVAIAFGSSTRGPAASFRTPAGPGEAVKFVVASCTSGRVTEYPSFTTMKSFDPEFLVHEGDWGYADLTSTARRGDHF